MRRPKRCVANVVAYNFTFIGNLVAENDGGGREEMLMRTRFSLLIHLEKFEKALSIYHEYGFGNDLRFEKAYCLYRLGRFRECLVLTERNDEEVENLGRKMVILRAQTLYRLNRFEEAMVTFKDATLQDDDRISVNVLAAQTCQAALFGGSNAERMNDLIDVSYETQFNASGYYSIMGKHEKALDLIETAIDWARESLEEEGLDELEIMQELKSYYLHRAYLHSRLDHADLAKKDLKSVLNIGSDGNTLEVAQFNELVLDKHIVFDAASTLLKTVKLGPTQRPYAMLHLALKYKEDGKLKTTSRILRKLVKIKSIRPLATALLFEVLLQMKAENEIRARAESCEMMCSLWEAYNFYCNRLYPHRWQRLSMSAGLLGLIYSIKIPRSKRLTCRPWVPNGNACARDVELCYANAWQLQDLTKILDQLREIKTNFAGKELSPKIDVAIRYLEILLNAIPTMSTGDRGLALREIGGVDRLLFRPYTLPSHSSQIVSLHLSQEPAHWLLCLMKLKTPEASKPSADTNTTNHDRIANAPPYLIYDENTYEQGLKAFVAKKSTIESTSPLTAYIPPSSLDLSGFDEFLASKIDAKLQRRRGESRLGKLQNLIALIEDQVSDLQERRNLRQLLADSQPRQSKWFDPNRPGQAELYDELERVLLQLKSHTPYSGPFLQKVNRKEVTDYYEIIKRPMDLSTMTKKLRALTYKNRDEFQADLDLIYENCYSYNSDPESPFRRHADHLKEWWVELMRRVPDICVETKDDIDSILSAHLDRFSDDDSPTNSSKTSLSTTNQSIITMNNPSQGTSSSTPLRSELSDLSLHDPFTILFPTRSSQGMGQFHRSRNGGAMTDTLYFHQSFPDSLCFKADIHPEKEEIEVSESLKSTCDRFLRLREINIKVSASPSLSLPERRFILSADSFTPKLSHLQLSSSIAWLCLQSGYESFHQAALTCFTDVITEFIREIVHSLKLYIEVAPATLSISLQLANQIIQDHFLKGSRQLLRMLRDEPRRLRRRLDRTIDLVRERKSIIPEISTGELADGEAIPDMDLDLDLLVDESPIWSLPIKTEINSQTDADSRSGVLVTNGNPFPTSTLSDPGDQTLQESSDGPSDNSSSSIGRKRKLECLQSDKIKGLKATKVKDRL